MSKAILLNQNWIFSKEGHDEPVTLPHTWNAIDGQDGGNDYYRGTCCYTTVLLSLIHILRLLCYDTGTEVS